jgi:capsular polysaccharide biosynthesis protein
VSLLEIARLSIQRGWIILLCAAIGAAGMFVYSGRQVPVYRSTYQVILEPARSDFGVSAAMRSMLNSYLVYLNSTAVAAEIVAELGMGTSPQALKGGTSFSAVPDQSMIKIEVNDTDGNSANQVAYMWGQKLVQFRNRLNNESPSNEHILALPQDYPSYVLYRPRTLINTLLGGIGGIIVGALTVFALEFRSTRKIHTRHDLGATPVLATVPAETKSA